MDASERERDVDTEIPEFVTLMEKYDAIADNKDSPIVCKGGFIDATYIESW